VVQDKLAQAYPDPGARIEARQQIVTNLEQAFAGASQPQPDPRWFVPHNAMAAIAQSAMNESAQPGSGSAARVSLSTGGGAAAAPAFAEAPFEQFGPLDPGWIECVIDGFKTLIEGDAPFVQHKALTDFLYPMPDQITIALVSDWGADNEPAQNVAAQIKAASPDIVIHLGDIYYAGQQNETKTALKNWPLPVPGTGATSPSTSFALNGNHEMYSGGKAYFNTFLKAFGQKASYFGLRNTNWQILAFDSAYVEQRLLAPGDPAEKSGVGSQWTWLVDKMQTSPTATILLSHHQPVSAFAIENGDAENLRDDFQNFIAAAGRQIYGWFFGHEHRCTIYEDSPAQPLPYAARLIGHGCIPHSPPPEDQQPDPGCFSFSNMNFRTKPNGDAVSGFALLKFNGAVIDIQYIDEDGALFWEESWAVG
jgi:hypothetical protein